MAKKYLSFCFTLIILNIIPFIYQWIVKDVLEFRYIFFSIVVLITFLASYLYNTYKTISKKHLLGLFFILLFCTIYKSRNTIFPHEIRLENKIMSPRIIHLVILQFLVFFRKNILMFHIANCIFFSLFFPLK